MKTKSIFAAILITLGSISFTANAESPNEINVITKEKISQMIISKVSFTDDLTKYINEGVVLVNISLKNEQIVINMINASDDILENHVKTQLGEIRFPKADFFDADSMNFKFVFHKNQ